MGQINSRLPSVTYAKITKTKLFSIVNNLNNRFEEGFNDCSNVKMLFAIKEKKDSRKGFINEIFNSWKKNVSIRCFSMTKNQTFSKSYTLYEFLKFYHSLIQILDASDASDDLTANKNLMSMSIFQEECCSIDGQCIICMERLPNAVLPCAHSYCEPCIAEFLNVQKVWQCPLCRCEFNTKFSDAAWVITEAPNRESVNAYLVENSNIIRQSSNSTVSSETTS